MTYKYSVIIPYKGRPLLLNKAVASIPDREDIQIIIVHNDVGPLEDECRFEFKKAALMVFNYPYGGPGGARNAAIGKALGRFILYCDADDYFSDDAFDYFDRDCSKSYDIVYYGVDSRNTSIGLRGSRHKPYTKLVTAYLGTHDESDIRYNWGSACGKLFRTELIKKNGILFGEGPGGDVLFSAKAGYYAGAISVHSDIVYIMVEDSQSMNRHLSYSGKLNKFRMYLEKNRFLRSKGIHGSGLMLLKWLIPSLPGFLKEKLKSPWILALGHKFDKVFFEVHICDHCNLNCAGCSHFSPISEKMFCDYTSFRRDMERMRSLFPGKGVKRIRLLGGEPLLHPELVLFLKTARECFPAAEIQLVTNGLLIDRMAENFWKECVDSRILIYVSRYPVNLDFKKMEETFIDKNVLYHIESGIPKFRKDHLDREGKCSGFRSWMKCMLGVRCSQLRDGKLYMCCKPAYIEALNKSFGTHFQVCKKDYVDIYATDARRQIRRYQRHPIPFCRYCDISGWNMFEWRRSSLTEDEWL